MIRQRVFKLFALAIMLLYLGIPQKLAADAPNGSKQVQIKGIQIGIGGRYKVGCWTPVAVTLTGASHPTRARLVLTVPDGDGVPTQITMADGKLLEVPAKVESTFRGYVKLGRMRGRVTVNLEAEDGTRVQQKSGADQLSDAVRASQQVVLTIGPRVGVDRVVRLWRRSKTEAVVAAHIESPQDVRQLPDQWWGYEGVDAVVMVTSQSAVLETFTYQQWEAFRLWLRNQGRLIVCVGANGDELLAEGGMLRDLVPGRLDRVASQCHASALETFVDQPYPIHVPRDLDGSCQMQVSVLADVTGSVVASERVGNQRRPMIVRGSYGFGQVVFAAIDLDTNPIREWKGRPRLLSKMLEWTLGARAEDTAGQSVDDVQLAGFEDLNGQLRGALDQFPAVTMLRFELVAILILIYAALIGPVDYFLLRRFVRRMEWTWLTFPLIVVFFCVLALVLTHGTKGNQLRINQVDLVDVDVSSRTIRGTMWAHLYSPITDAYDLSLLPLPECGAADPARSNVLLSWQGLPGRALSGMRSATSDQLFSQPYRLAVKLDGGRIQRSEITQLPIQVASTKSLIARWWTHTDLATPSALRLTPDGRLLGEIGNPLDVELNECYLLHAPWAYPLGRMAPDSVLSIDDDSPRRNLQWRLTRTAVRSKNDISTPWDRYNRNVPRILELMMFYQAAGGRSYTGLLHRYQDFVDLSSQLEAGRPVLVGLGDQRATELTRGSRQLRDQYDRHWTFYRFLLPVELAAND